MTDDDGGTLVFGLTDSSRPDTPLDSASRTGMRAGPDASPPGGTYL